MNIDTFIFLMNSYKIYKEAGAPDSEFIENLENLENDNQIDKKEKDMMLVLIKDKEVPAVEDDSPVVTLYERVLTNSGDGCSGPTYDYKPIKARPVKVPALIKKMRVTMKAGSTC